MLGTQKKVAINFWLLLSIYAVIPVLFAVALIDFFFFNSTLKQLLPATPETFVIYGILFNVPHILASYFSFADKEYLAFYKKRLLIELPLVLLLLGGLGYLYPVWGYMLFIAYTIYHVIFQQAGLTLLFGGKYSKIFEVWRWLPVLFITVGHLSIYHPSLLTSYLHIPTDTFPFLLGALVGIFILISVYLYSGIIALRGKIYFFATALSFAGSYFLYVWGYPLLSILLLRFVHDVTAFIIYAVHDHNRAVEKRTNVLYKLFPKHFIPVFLLTPILAIALGYFITTSPLHQTNLLFVIVFASTHYYLESVIWKRDTLHRKQLAFT